MIKHPPPIEEKSKEKRGILLGLLLILALFFASCTIGSERAVTPVPKEPTASLVGMASYYGNKFEGRKTANGEIYRGENLTAAHQTLPFGTHLRVTNLRNGESVVVRVNDRGPFVANRILDLSLAAAQKLQIIQAGVSLVQIEILSQ